MNSKAKLIVGIVAFLLVIVLATVGYNYLSQNYSESEVQNEEVKEPEELQKAPDITIFDDSKNEVKLSEKFGKPVIVNFWATWCGPCKSEMPAFDKLYKEYGDKVEFMMVNQTDGARDTMEGVKEFIENEGYAFPVYYDVNNEAYTVYGATSIPATLFINKDGEIVEGRLGAMDEQTIKGYIDKLLGGNN